MNVVMIVPTGLGAEIGGHAGDANPVAKLLASLCDNLITHPNVVNASDINEMTENTWYVEGSILDRFLRGESRLRRPDGVNKILVVANSPVPDEVINSVSAARVTIGIDASVLALNTPLVMRGGIHEGQPTAFVGAWQELVEQVCMHEFDALAITTPITVDRATKVGYFRDGGPNPWGYVEARASRLIAAELNKPVAHAPCEDDPEWAREFSDVVDPRMAAEIVSISYLHCVLKGLHRAPRISDTGLSAADVSVLVSPDGCYGPPHQACVANGIPVVVVEENQTVPGSKGAPVKHHDAFTYVANYLEAAGLIACMKAGVLPASVRRPLAPTKIRWATA